MNSKSVGKLIVFSLLLGFLAFVVILQIHQASFLTGLCKEDGIVEWLTALGYFLAAAIFILGCKKQRFKNPWYWFFGALFFAIAGEEISWGQRILGIATPETLNDVNVQQELNLHNISGIHDKVRLLAVLIVLFICYVLPVSNWLLPTLKNYYRRIRLPIYPLWLSGITTIALSFMVIPRLLLGKEVFNLDEIGELYLAIGFLGFSLAAYWAEFALKSSSSTQPTLPLESEEGSLDHSVISRR